MPTAAGATISLSARPTMGKSGPLPAMSLPSAVEKPRLTAVEDDGSALMAAVASGDHDAFAVVYDRFAAMVYGLSLRIVEDPTLADEVVSDIFFELWQRPERYDRSRGRFATYLLMLTRCRSIDRLRREAGPSGMRLTRYDPKREEPTSVDDDPLLPIAEGEARTELVRVLNTLAVDQRRALELAYFTGCTQREIAERLDQPLGTVKTWIRSALEHLRMRWSAAGGEQL